MPTPKKDTAKAAAAGADKAKEGADKAAKAAGATFDKLKKHFEPKKVDAWQEKWLAVPANRKKYEKITDAPEVVAEEMMALTNDIIDFAQGEETGKSHLFSKVKKSLGGVVGKAASATKDAKKAAEKTAKAGAGAAKKSATKAKKAAKK